MNEYRLPEETQIGRVHLRVSDLRRALAFYADLLGFRPVGRQNSTAMLSATGTAPVQIVLTEQAGARSKPSGTTGLYHVAIRFPSRRALAQTFQRLVAHEWPFQGFADHLVSEALYLADAEGNGLELYVDRPEEQWQRKNGQIVMATDPFDVQALLAEVGEDGRPWTGVDPETDIGHVHLQVADLAEAEAFYSGLLGLDVTQRGYPGALFLSAGGYHHHLGVNVWAGKGAPPPPLDAVGLLAYALRLPDEDAWHVLRDRVLASGTQIEQRRDSEAERGFLIRDPAGNGVALQFEKL